MTNQTHNQIIEQLVADNQDRDAIIIQLVSEHDLSLNKATKVYAEYAREHGLTRQATSHKEGVLDGLREKYARIDEETGDAYAEGWTARAVADEVVEIVADYGVAESTARDYCKAFSTELGIDHPVLNPREAIFAWFLEREQAGDVVQKDEFLAYATDELGRSKSNANEYWKGYELHLHLVGRNV